MKEHYMKVKVNDRLNNEMIKEIAKRLVSPVRCGGLDYIDGKSFYRIGGKLYTPKQVERLKVKP